MVRIPQRAISIPEPTNDVDSLWSSVKAIKEAVEMIQGIRGNREYALKADLQDDINDLEQQILNIDITGGSGATQLNELSDVNTSTTTNRNVLVADGVDFESRPLVEADISDLVHTGGVTSAGFGTWRHRTETSAPPSTGQIRFDNADPVLSTEVFVHETNVGSTDMATFLALIDDGAIIYLQDKSDAANFFIIEVSSYTDSGVYVTFGIQNIELEGTEPSQNQEMVFFASVTAAGVVTAFGTPVNNQLAVWTDSDTIEGDPNLTYDSVAERLTLEFLLTVTGSGGDVPGILVDSTPTSANSAYFHALSNHGAWLRLEADDDNIGGELGLPFIWMSSDGGTRNSSIGMTGVVDRDGRNNVFTNMVVDGLAIHAEDATGSIGIGVNGQVAIFINAANQVTFPGGGISEVNDLTDAVVWDDVPVGNIVELAVTQHEAALSIVAANIDDEAAADGEVMMSDGAGGVAWEVPPGGGVYDYAKRASTSTSTVTSTPAAIPWQTELVAGTDVTWDSGNNTRIVCETTGTYKIGGYVTVLSAAGVRAQAACEIYINGTPDGDQRSGMYVRNSGTSYDWWTMEISTEPFEMTANDYFELFVGQVTGATYGYAGSLTMNLRGAECRVWVERVK